MLWVWGYSPMQGPILKRDHPWFHALLLSFGNSFFSLLCWVGVNCGIYNYIIFEFICSMAPLYPPPPDSWNRLNRYHFCIYTHVYTFFAPYSPSYAFSLSPPPSHWCQPSPMPSCSLILQKWKEKRYKEKHDILLVWDKDSYTGSFLVIFPHIYMLYP
jgi:hypothetical protein